MKRPRTKNSPKRHLETFFGSGLEIVDAKKPLMLLPSEQDFADAVRYDPHNCGYARCCARLLGATKVLFFKSVVYIDHLGEDGIRRIYRYAPCTAVTRTLNAFDRLPEGGKLKPSAVLRAFQLRPPSRQSTLEGQRRTNRIWRKGDAGQAIIAARNANKRVQTIARDVDNTKMRLDRLQQQQSPQAPSVIEAKQQLKKLRNRLSDAIDDRRDKEAIAQKVRTHAYNKAPLLKPMQHELDGNVRDGRFFWNSTSGIALQ